MLHRSQCTFRALQSLKFRAFYLVSVRCVRGNYEKGAALHCIFLASLYSLKQFHHEKFSCHTAIKDTISLLLTIFDFNTAVKFGKERGKVPSLCCELDTQIYSSPGTLATSLFCGTLMYVRNQNIEISRRSSYLLHNIYNCITRSVM